MRYPDINRYQETLYNPYGLFKTLKNIEFRTDRRGMPSHISGSSSVIFKGVSDGLTYAVKCFTRPNNNRKQTYNSIEKYLSAYNSDYFVPICFLEEEIYVYDDFDRGCYYPLLLSEWVEGCSLGDFLKEMCSKKETKILAETARRFDTMALWLLEQDIAHGDLKYDNILVMPDGALKLIDYDGMYTPDMAGKESPELGTRHFQHPARTALFFNRHTDDYSIALISVCLHALCEYPEWFGEYEDDENIMFEPDELVEGKCVLINRIKDRWLESGNTALYRLAVLLGSKEPRLDGLAETMERIVTREIPDIYDKLDSREQMTIIRKDGFYGFLNETTGKVIDAVYDDVQPFNNGIAPVRIRKRWFYIDTEGRKIIDATGYDCAGAFHDDRALVSKGRKWGYIDQAGQAVVPPRYEEARNFSEGLAAVKERKGKYGYIDTNGNVRIEPVFDILFDFREAVAVAGDNGRFGYIDCRGNWLIKPEFSFASSFRNGKAVAERDGMEIKLTKNDNNRISYEM